MLLDLVACRMEGQYILTVQLFPHTINSSFGCRELKCNSCRLKMNREKSRQHVTIITIAKKKRQNENISTSRFPSRVQKCGFVWRTQRAEFTVVVVVVASGDFSSGIVVKDIRLRFHGTLSSLPINCGLAQKQSAPVVILITAAQPFARAWRKRVVILTEGYSAEKKRREKRNVRSGRNEVDRDKYGKEGLK